MIRVEDPDLYRYDLLRPQTRSGAMVNVAAKAKRLLTAGVTASPEFMLRNSCATHSPAGRSAKTASGR